MNWSDSASTILVALISAGLLGYIVDFLKARKAKRDARTPEGEEERRISIAGQSIAVVALARDELVHDNERLREEFAEAELRHAAERERWVMERSRWDFEREEYRSEIEGMKIEMKHMLERLESLQNRHP